MLSCRYILPPKSAHDAYEFLMQSKNITPQSMELPDGTSAVWIGNPDAEKVIIYFPGGGYCIPALPVHFELVNALTTNLRNHGQDIGILFLVHDLAPHRRWPHQLEQAVSLVEYAIETLGKIPSNMVIGGSSCACSTFASCPSPLTKHYSTPLDQRELPWTTLSCRPGWISNSAPKVSTRTP